MPFDFFGLGQPVAEEDEQHQGNDLGQNQQQNIEHIQGQHQNMAVDQMDQGNDFEEVNNVGQWLNQQVNPWDPAWPNQQQQHPGAQQQAVQQQAHQPPQQLPNGQNIIDLNLDPADPQEVVINPVQVAEEDGFLELNDLINEDEVNIQQPQVNDQILIPDENPNHINGFPMPNLVDVLGEEIEPEHLMMEQENLEAQNGDGDDFNPDLLVGPGE